VSSDSSHKTPCLDSERLCLGLAVTFGPITINTRDEFRKSLMGDDDVERDNPAFDNLSQLSW